MELRPHQNEIEQQAAITVEAPVVETLLDPTESARLWDGLPEIVPQIERHAERSNLFEELFSKLPNPTTSLETAVDQGVITTELASDIYSELASLLSDLESRRLLLYLPFELLPSASWNPQSSYLHMTVQRFKHIYRHAWYSLLTDQDVRANFVDGDVIEIDQRQDDLPRVVKAAHLTPALLEKGIISFEEAEELLETTDDPLLQQSIRESLSAYGIHSGVDHNISDSGGKLEASPTDAHVSKGRQAWLDQRERESEIAIKAQRISRFLLTGELQPTTIEWTPEKDETGYQAIAEGIYKAIESTAWLNLEQAKDLYAQYAPMLENLWLNTDSPNIKEQTTRAYRRLHRLGIVEQEALEQIGIDFPTLTGPFSKNLDFLSEDVERLRAAASKIAATPNLCRAFYPVILLNGSRLKGYGTRSSDVDTSIFIRPGINETDKEDIHSLVHSLFKSDGNNYEPIEFWLEGENEQLSVRNLHSFDPHVADNHWAQNLFGSAWIGDEADIQHIRERLLPTYFEDSEKVIHGRKARGLYIEELERDRLQYRLLQKGYSRHYPHYPRGNWTRQPEIDGQADYWDSGYRRLATQIYINSVFLPKTTT